MGEWENNQNVLLSEKAKQIISKSNLYSEHIHIYFSFALVCCDFLLPVYEIQWLVKCAVGIWMILFLYIFIHFQKFWLNHIFIMMKVMKIVSLDTLNRTWGKVLDTWFWWRWQGNKTHNGKVGHANPMEWYRAALPASCQLSRVGERGERAVWQFTSPRVTGSGKWFYSPPESKKERERNNAFDCQGNAIVNPLLTVTSVKHQTKGSDKLTLKFLSILQDWKPSNGSLIEDLVPRVTLCRTLFK